MTENISKYNILWITPLYSPLQPPFCCRGLVVQATAVSPVLVVLFHIYWVQFHLLS